MRLIDADALGVGRCNKDVLPSDCCTGWNRLIDIINEAPTVDAVPIRHGRWVDNGIPGSMLSGCSVCGFTCGSSSFFYCPSCGAKMNGATQ